MRTLGRLASSPPTDVAPLARLREAGIRVGLGTDSPSSAVSLDMFDELRAALLLARASSGDPEALSTASALRMATLDGARALGLEDRGALAPGLLADLVAVRLDRTPFWPCDDPVSALVLGGSPALVTLVAIGGDVLYGVDSTEFERTLQTAAAARSLLLEQAETPPNLMIIWIRSRKGWVGAVFFVLAAIFAASFIIGGVGTGSQASLSDIIGQDDGTGTSTTSTREPRVAPEEGQGQPKNATAVAAAGRRLRERSRGPPTRPRRGRKVVALKPKDMDSYQRLALAQAQVATNNSNQAQQLQQQALTSSPGTDSTFAGGTLGSLSEDPVTQAQAASEQEQQSKLLTEAGKIGKKADVWWKRSTATYGKLVELPRVRQQRSRGHRLAQLRLGGAGRERRPEGDQGLRGIPQDRARRRQRAAGQDGPQAAQGLREGGRGLGDATP